MAKVKRGYNNLGAVQNALVPSASLLVQKATVDIAANAANDAPRDTGALAESYTAEFDGPLEGTAGSNMEYAPYVEYGTIHTGAQPHLVPAADRVEQGIKGAAQIMGDRLERAAKSGV